MTALTRGGLRCAALAWTVALVALAIAGEAHAAPAPPEKACILSQRDQAPPGGTAAYDVSVTRRNTSCAVAVKVMVAFHRCRTDGGSSCRRRVLAHWRCSGRRGALPPLGQPTVFAGHFTCTSRGRRVRGAYQENGPKCFGAAARDPQRPCVNPTLSVYPSSDDPHALDEGAAGCHDDDTRACVFGAPAEAAKGHFAVLGDSHVFHWRGALTVLARTYSWRGYSHSTGGCFFSAAVHLFSADCGAWYGATMAWFTAHPEVTTVFVTANADTPVAVEAGRTLRDVKVDGYKRAFAALPKTVRHIIVLRDPPASSQPTLDCVARVAAAATQRAGQVCALQRSVGLREDTAVLAARELRSERYGIIDLTHFFCGARNCYPVIGGVLVNADVWGHIVVSYMRSLQPYLLREFRKLSAHWRRAS